MAQTVRNRQNRSTGKSEYRKSVSRSAYAVSYTHLGLLPDEGKSMIESAGLTVRNISEVYNEDESLHGKICGLSYSVGT